MIEDAQCEACKYYDADEGTCGAFECFGIDCPELPCEHDPEASDAVTDL